MSDRKHAEGDGWSGHVEESTDEHSDTAVLTLRGIEIVFDQAAVGWAGGDEVRFWLQDVPAVHVQMDVLPDDAVEWIQSILRDGRTVEQLDA